MIISKTPLRISFFSGGSDLPSFYTKKSGAALSVTIDKYIYVMAHEKPNAGSFITAFDQVENFESLDAMTHDITRETLKYFDIKTPTHVTSISDIPSRGSGLGSSSAFTVGLINCIQETTDKKKLAELACTIEMERCGYPIGKQDQYAAATGGLNLFGFTKNDVTNTPLNIDAETLEKLQENLILVYSGIGRSANRILSEQSKLMDDEAKFNLVLNGRNKAITAADMLMNGDIDSFGDLLHLAWMDKKQITKEISNSRIDQIYTNAIDNGALGGKVLGAGGGGFLLFYCPKQDQEKVINALLTENDCRVYDFKFTYEGSKLIYKEDKN
jgi:D-glycero-alpha-D-manno-heptose-7-phosphate kinase